jgi:hypothetical protein
LSRNRQGVYDTEEYTALDLAAKTAGKVNECVDSLNQYDAQINLREKSDDITNKRKLSVKGDFSGTILGRTIASIFSDIGDSNTLVKQLIGMVNKRESIGTIYDGGNYLDVEPPITSIEGGIY